MTKRPSIRVDAGGDVNLSADDVGRDKITNPPVEKSKGEPERKVSGGSLAQAVIRWASNVPILVKLVGFIRSLF